jgi:ribonuclease P protein component
VLPGQERLTRSSLFQRAYNTRKTISSPLFTLYVVNKTGKQPVPPRADGAVLKHSENGVQTQVKARSPAKMPLVGFVVAKKVCKSACARNRAKRRIREAYRILRTDERAAALSLGQWYALVWVVHEKAMGSSWQEIKDTVADCLRRADSRFGVGNHAKKGDKAN